MIDHVSAWETLAKSLVRESQTACKWSDTYIGALEDVLKEMDCILTSQRIQHPFGWRE